MRESSVLIRGGLLLGSPLLVWLALPGNFSFWPLLALCLVPFLFLAGGAPSPAAAFSRGFAAGSFLYVLQLYWIVSVLHQYGGLNPFAAVPAMLLLAAYMSVYAALFSAGFYLIRKNCGWFMLLIGSACLWVGLDWLRSWLFSGFPWMDIGYGLWSQPRLLQAADLFGHYGYSFLIVLVNVTIYLVLHRDCRALNKIGAVMLLAGIGAGLAYYSSSRWQDVEKMIAAAPKARVGIVQGNVEQTRKWSPEERLRTVNDYVRLSRSLLNDQPPSLIIWPETALPFYPQRDEYLEPVSAFVDSSGAALLSGAPWYEVEESRTSRLIYYYNGAMLMKPNEGFAFGYYKSHLVPYGEYVPLQKYMSFLAPLVEAAGNFSRGTIAEPLQAGTIRAGVLICFESIFGELGRSWVETGANMLVNLTNDAWYGKSSAPHQSWAMTVYRSVETRRSLVRSANTGISGFIDPLGRVKNESGIFVEWAAAEDVPLLSSTTFFVRRGYLLAPVCGGAACVIIVLALINRKRYKSHRLRS